MDTLYVTDLDGTLLNNKGELSKYTIYWIFRQESAGIPLNVVREFRKNSAQCPAPCGL